jgi:hypothetical protein
MALQRRVVVEWDERGGRSIAFQLILISRVETPQTAKCSTEAKKSFDTRHSVCQVPPTHRNKTHNKHMRTKTLLLTAALFAAGICASMAQVYSVNSVGYVNKTLVASGYTLISNPLNGTNNLLSTILPTPPDGTAILRWDPVTQGFTDPFTYIDGLGWLPDTTINPGEGFFVSNPSGAATVTFVGEVPQGNLTNQIAGGTYTLLAHIVPQSIALDAVGVDFPAQDGDSVLMWDSINQTFTDPFSYIDGLGWLPSAPTPAVGEGFFLSSVGGVPRTWTRTFSVNN